MMDLKRILGLVESGKVGINKAADSILEDRELSEIEFVRPEPKARGEVQKGDRSQYKSYSSGDSKRIFRDKTARDLLKKGLVGEVGFLACKDKTVYQWKYDTASATDVIQGIPLDWDDIGCGGRYKIDSNGDADIDYFYYTSEEAAERPDSWAWLSIYVGRFNPRDYQFNGIGANMERILGKAEVRGTVDESKKSLKEEVGWMESVKVLESSLEQLRDGCVKLMKTLSGIELTEESDTVKKILDHLDEAYYILETSSMVDKAEQPSAEAEGRGEQVADEAPGLEPEQELI
jgi:hypothetical protein